MPDADGHGDVIGTGPDRRPGVAVVDIRRFADGLITEHRDVKQPVPDRGQLPNGMF